VAAIAELEEMADKMKAEAAAVAEKAREKEATDDNKPKKEGKKAK